jgi:hypothetical protein
VENSKGGQTIPVGRIKGSADSNKVLLNKIEFSRKNRTPGKVAPAWIVLMIDNSLLKKIKI